MNLYDQQTIHGQGVGLSYKDRQIAAYKGVITKLKKKIERLEQRHQESVNAIWLRKGK